MLSFHDVACSFKMFLYYFLNGQFIFPNIIVYIIQFNFIFFCLESLRYLKLNIIFKCLIQTVV